MAVILHWFCSHTAVFSSGNFIQKDKKFDTATYGWPFENVHGCALLALQNVKAADICFNDCKLSTIKLQEIKKTSIPGE